MRARWIIAVLAAAGGGCELVSGLDRLSLVDAGVSGDACATCEAAADEDVALGDVIVPPAMDGGLTIHCGDVTCTHGICCREGAGTGIEFTYACMELASSCTGSVLACDSENDCPAGQVCCASSATSGCAGISTRCETAATCYAGVSDIELCSATDPTCTAPNAKCAANNCLTGYSSCQ